MKKRISSFLILVVVFLLIYCWIKQYKWINQYFNSYDVLHTQYTIGEFINLEENIILEDSAPGYSITVKDYDILSYQDYVEALSNCKTISDPPEYVLWVELLIQNIDSSANGIFLPDFMLYSHDMYTDVNYELTSCANPILTEDSYGISLKKGNSYTCYIVYNLRQSIMSSSTFNNLNNTPFYLQITSYPEQKTVILQNYSNQKK